MAKTLKQTLIDMLKIYPYRYNERDVNYDGSTAKSDFDEIEAMINNASNITIDYDVGYILKETTYYNVDDTIYNTVIDYFTGSGSASRFGCAFGVFCKKPNFVVWDKGDWEHSDVTEPGYPKTSRVQYHFISVQTTPPTALHVKIPMIPFKTAFPDKTKLNNLYWHQTYMPTATAQALWDSDGDNLLVPYKFFNPAITNTQNSFFVGTMISNESNGNNFYSRTVTPSGDTRIMCPRLYAIISLDGEAHFMIPISGNSYYNNCFSTPGNGDLGVNPFWNFQFEIGYPVHVEWKSSQQGTPYIRYSLGSYLGSGRETEGPLFLGYIYNNTVIDGKYNSLAITYNGRSYSTQYVDTQRRFMVYKDDLEGYLNMLFGNKWSYMKEDSPSPIISAHSPKLTSLDLNGLDFTPTFSSNNYGPYTSANTNSPTLTINVVGNEDVSYTTIGLNGQVFTDTTTINLNMGSNTITVYAYYDASTYVSYTIIVNRIETEQTEPGQADNPTHNEGGSGELVRDTITLPNNVFTNLGLGTHTYALDWVQIRHVLDSFNNPNIFQTLTNLDFNQLISCIMWPFVLPTTHATGWNGVNIGKSSIMFTDLGELHDTCLEYDGNDTIALDFGTITIEEYFGGFLDYNPYTSLMLYLPYCGIQNISANDVVGHTVNLKLFCDASTGSGLYLLGIQYTDANGQIRYAWKYKWPCQVGQPIPITSENMAQIQKAILQNVGQAAVGIATGNPFTVISGSIGILEGTASTQSSTLGGQGDSNDRNGPQTPYFLISRPDTRVPSDYNKNYGRPSLKTKRLGDLRGFTTVPNPIINTNATVEEKNRIISLLKDGIYIK